MVLGTSVGVLGERSEPVIGFVRRVIEPQSLAVVSAARYIFTVASPLPARDDWWPGRSESVTVSEHR